MNARDWEDLRIQTACGEIAWELQKTDAGWEATVEFGGCKIVASRVRSTLPYPQPPYLFRLRAVGADGAAVKGIPEDSGYWVNDAFRNALAALPDLSMFGGEPPDDAWLAKLVRDEEVIRARGALVGSADVMAGRYKLQFQRYASGEVRIHEDDEAEADGMGSSDETLSPSDIVAIIDQLAAAIEFMRGESQP